MAQTDRVVVLDRGRVLAHGLPDEIQNEPEGAGAYLGEPRHGVGDGRATEHVVKEFVNLVLSGLVTGAIYSIMASGLVLTYTTSGIFNFAHGAVAFVTAYLYYQLNTGVGLPIVPSLIISVFVFAPLMGLLLDRILLRRLAKAPVYAKIVGSIGLLVVLPALGQWLVVAVGDRRVRLGPDRQRRGDRGRPGAGHRAGAGQPVYHPFRALSLDSDQLAVLIVAASRPRVLWYVIRRTRWPRDACGGRPREARPGCAASTPAAPRPSRGS